MDRFVILVFMFQSAPAHMDGRCCTFLRLHMEHCK